MGHDIPVPTFVLVEALLRNSDSGLQNLGAEVRCKTSVPHMCNSTLLAA